MTFPLRSEQSGQRLGVSGLLTAVTHSSQRIERDQSRPSFYRDKSKRWLDILLVLLASLPVLMLILPLALLVARDGYAPFYSQERVGRNGRVFRLWKLRTMVVDSEPVLNQHLEANPMARAEWELHQKLRDDPRITRTGSLLRRASLDELPQLWNVLIGDMSLVGPRPMMTSQRALYPGTEYYTVRPGLTGLWQISERSNSSFQDRARYDRIYCEQVSLATDAGIVAKTFSVVLKGTGY